MTANVSILMPIYNGERYLGEAVDSILAQTFGDFELIVVDDGSTDATPDILGEYDDSRIRLLANESNRGLAYSLNTGIAVATGDLIARMDADDVAEPQRLERQVAFLGENPQTGIVGSICRQIDEKGRELGVSTVPLGDAEIRWRSLIGNPFFHPSVMIRMDVLDRHGLRYDEAFGTAQDYDLWVRLLRHTKAANLDEPLVRRRLHGGSVSRTRRRKQYDDHARVALRAMTETWSDCPVTSESFAALRELLTTSRPLKAVAADRNRCTLLEHYADLLERFVQDRQNDNGVADLTRRESVVMAYIALHPPLRPGTVRLLRRLAKLEPGLAGAFVGWAFGAVRRRMTGRTGQ